MKSIIAVHSYKGGTRKGSPATPLAPDEIFRKFYDCAQLAYPAKKVSQILDVIMNLEKADDIRKLTRLVR